MGTLAIGSFVLAIIWSIRTFLAYLTAKIKSAQKETGTSNAIVDCFLGCMNCYVACFDRFIRWLNKHIYIQTVLNSVGFCGGFTKASEILMSNLGRFGVLNGLLELVMNFGTFLISTLVTIIGYFMLKYTEKFTKIIFETFSPLIVIFFPFIVFRLFSYLPGWLLHSLCIFMMLPLILYSIAILLMRERMEVRRDRLRILKKWLRRKRGRISIQN